MKKASTILLIIVLAQFFCTSLWFAGNGVLNDLITVFNLENGSLASLTSSVQFGFIVGTLSFALLNIADRFSPSKVFFVSGLLGAVFNLGIIYPDNTINSLVIFRFLTGFFLAGIYPVGMKIAADHFDKNLGKSLGYLVGALVLGTAFPHFLSFFTTALPWKIVIYSTSGLALLGSLLILICIPDGPFRKKSSSLKLNAIFQVFKKKDFRSAALGYFGHMWELYTFWAFIPVILGIYLDKNPTVNFNISLLSFSIIAIGSLGCILGGYLSLKWKTKKIAMIALAISGLCCLTSSLFFSSPLFIFILFVLLWGFTVIMDSPLFSTLVAKNAPVEIKGTALTIVNCLGYSLTIISIQTINYLREFIPQEYLFVVLAIGPVFGLLALKQNSKTIAH